MPRFFVPPRRMTGRVCQLILHHHMEGRQQLIQADRVELQGLQRRNGGLQGREALCIGFTSNPVLPWRRGRQSVAWQVPKLRDIANDRLRLMPRAVNNHQLSRPLGGRQFGQRTSVCTGIQKAGVGLDRQVMRSQTPIVIGNQMTAAQCFLHDPCRIEGMKSLANVLQNQDVRAIVDPRNRLAEAKRQRTKTLIAAFPQCVTQSAHSWLIALGDDCAANSQGNRREPDPDRFALPPQGSFTAHKRMAANHKANAARFESRQEFPLVGQASSSGETIRKRSLGLSEAQTASSSIDVLRREHGTRVGSRVSASRYE